MFLYFTEFFIKKLNFFHQQWSLVVLRIFTMANDHEKKNLTFIFKIKLKVGK